MVTLVEYLHGENRAFKAYKKRLKPLTGPSGVTTQGWTYSTNGCRNKQQKQTAALTVYRCILPVGQFETMEVI